MQLKYATVFRLNVNIPPSPTSELYNPFAVMPTMKLVPLDSVPADEWHMAPTIMYVDSQPAIRSCINQCVTKGNRHLSVMEMYIRECVITTKTVQLVFCPTNLMVADALTKILQRAAQAVHMVVVFGARNITEMVQTLI